MAVTPLFALIALFIVAIALVVAGFALGSQKPQGLRAALVGVGVVILAGLGYLVCDQIFNETNSDAVVNGVCDEEYFRVALDNKRLYTDGSSYHFEADFTWDEVVSVLEAHYPDGAPAGEDAWELVSASTPVLAFAADQAKHQFSFVGQIALVTFDSNANSIRFAYPVGPEGIAHFNNAVAAETTMDFQTLRSYYEQVEGAVVTEHDITVPASVGFVRLEYADGRVTATHADQPESQ